MNFNDDFVKNELVEIDIDGRVFKVKLVSAGDEQRELNDIVFVKPDGKLGYDAVKEVEYYLKSVKDAPYNLVNSIGQVQDKNFVDGSVEEKLMTLNRLPPKLIKRLIMEIKSKNEVSFELKKKSKTG